jgi:ferrochelatase|tara:strand:+ start:1002 stop:2036 length:1035 start_codon:yes stop_codon:yes gene_type:complete
MKKAVILFNLGGPDKLENIEPFLFNLFNDPAILSVPGFLRYLFAQLISKKRTPIAKKIYKKIGGNSPILKLTNKQSASLEKKLNDNNKQDIYKCFVVMRYWGPRAESVLNIVKEFNPDEMILLPLYPQYSTSTSGSSIKEWHDVCSKNNYQKPAKTICCYPTETEFLNAHVSLINNELKNLNNFRLIFSAHGLPERNIKRGDPYQWQVEQSVNKITEQLNISNLDWILSYQSRVGILKWIGPFTDDEIVKSAKLNKTIVVVPISFVSEHSETLVELDMEYKKLAEQNGCENFIRIPALGTRHEFISSLANLVFQSSLLEKRSDIYHPLSKCPYDFKKCPCSDKL